MVTYDVDAMLDAIAMAEAVAGGADALRERPTIALYVNVTRGLVHNGDSLRKLLILAERGLPALWIPVTSGGTTGPVTMAGNIALNNAGVLVGRRAGAARPRGHAGGGARASAATRWTCGRWWTRTRSRTTGARSPSLAHHYGLPMFSLAGGSDCQASRTSRPPRRRRSRCSWTRSPAATSSTTAGTWSPG